MYKPIYFSESEFVQASPACTISDLSEELLERLDYARSLLGLPIKINSAFRSVEYELSKGRSGTSSHCKGLAVDIHCTDSNYRLEFLRCILFAGFRRIGIAPTFIHVDIDTSKPKSIWLY